MLHSSLLQALLPWRENWPDPDGLRKIIKALRHREGGPLLAWLDTRLEVAGTPFPSSWEDLNEDTRHSRLLGRILRGEELTPHKPPLYKGHPWYAPLDHREVMLHPHEVQIQEGDDGDREYVIAEDTQWFRVASPTGVRLKHATCTGDWTLSPQVLGYESYNPSTGESTYREYEGWKLHRSGY